jgi:ABC-type glycerol-3-phosphate transport system permease component
MRAGLRWVSSRLSLYLLLVILSALFGFPFFWTVSSSLKTPPEVTAYPPRWLPDVPQWNNYVEVLTLFGYPYGRWFINSLVLSTVATAGTVASSALVAYGFARFRFRGRDLLFMITLATLMLPAQVTLIPQFLMFHKLGWLNTFKPLWVPYWFGGGAFYIFLFRQFFLTLPRELDEAATIDGASYWRIFWTILAPLCKPVLATATMISFMAHWSDFLNPVIYLNRPELLTIAVGLRFMHEVPEMGAGKPILHFLMAGTVLSIIPPVVVFFTGQRFFVRGIVASAIKG